MSCIFYLLSYSYSSRPNQTTPSAPPAPASSHLPWLAAPPPPYHMYPPMLASPSLYSPTRPVILRRRQPRHAPVPELVNPHTPLHQRLDRRIFNSSYSYRPRPRLVLCLAALVRSSCAVRRPLALSTSSTTKRDKEMTVRQEDDSRDPPASWQYASKCLYSTIPKIWFLLMVGHLGLTPLST